MCGNLIVSKGSLYVYLFELNLRNLLYVIKYYDDIDQFENRKCPKDCKEHTNDNKYSMDDWNEIRKNVQKFGRSIDAVQEKL